MNPEHPGYRNLRLLSMFATLGCAVISGLLAFRLSRSILTTALSSILFLAFPLVHALAITCRCDMMALFLVTSGFLVAYHFRLDRRVLWACPLFALGLGYKMVFVAAPAAVLTFLVTQKRYRAGAEFAVGCGSAFLALILFFQIAVFPGQAMLLHMIKYNWLPFSWGRLRYFLILFALTLLPATIGAIESLRRTRDSLMTLYFGWAFAVAVLTIGKEGSSSLYFAEFVFVTCPLLATLLVSRVKREGIPSAAQAFVLVVASLLLTGWTLSPPQPADFTNDAAIQGYLRRRFPPGTPALSEYSGDLTRAGLVTSIPDLYQYSWLRCLGQIPPSELVRQIQDRRFAAVLVRTDLTNPEITWRPQDLCWTEDLRREIIKDYQIVHTFRAPPPDRHLEYYVWVPR